MFSIAYPATFRPDQNGRPVVSFPDFPRAHTDGKNMREAFDEATDCLGSVIAAHIADKQDIPDPSSAKRGQKLVPVPLWVAGKLALYRTMREQKITNTELARRLGCSPGSRNQGREAASSPVSPRQAHRRRAGRRCINHPGRQPRQKPTV
jgi:antitoxin HicB